jgi:AcrR family transcriptional regulator
MRADAQRNRERLVEVAREVFKERGLDAPLDEIARRAGVGAGTLYRHFPTREALHDAVMQAWVEQVQAHVDKALATEGGPRAQLLAWFGEYVEMLTRHKGSASAITTALGVPDSPIRSKCQIYAQANEKVLEALRADGALRDDVDCLSICRIVGGVATMADQASLDREAVRPMLEVVTDGLLKD